MQCGERLCRFDVIPLFVAAKRHSKASLDLPFPFLGTPGGFLDAANKELTPRTLSNLNLAQLQVIFNDLHTQIENYNDLLLKYLEERDDLHMEQVISHCQT